MLWELQLGHNLVVQGYMYKANKKFQDILYFTLDTSQSFQLPPPYLLVSIIAYSKKYL